MYTSVVVALIRRDDGRYLICQRSATSRYPLKWEFPGGKVEAGELPEEALQRELREELSIDADIGSLIHKQSVMYLDGGRFSIRFYSVHTWQGCVVNQVFADIQWVHARDLSQLDILDGSREICSMLYFSESNVK